MLGDLLFFAAGLPLIVLGTLTSALTSGFNIPVVDITNSFQYIFGNIWYFQGLMPVASVLDFLGRVLGFYSALMLFNVFMYLWSKIPVFGKGSAAPDK